jgi:protein tyrosine phosphatase
MFIENCSKKDIIRGKHQDAGENSMLIQIKDPDWDYAVPHANFKEVYQFSFADVKSLCQEDSAHAISDEQGRIIAGLLERAKANKMNVIVHCVVGRCRSGAVVEVGVSIGFTDPYKKRNPNPLVLSSIKKHLTKAK